MTSMTEEDDEENIVAEVEAGLSSPGKLKILRLLMRNPDHLFTRYEMGKKTPLNQRDIKNIVQTLTEIGWLKEYRYAHLQKYSINMDHTLVKRLYEFFREIGYV